MTNGEVEIASQNALTDCVKRDEMIFYTKKVMTIAEDRARDSERLILLENICTRLDKEVISKFELIQNRLDKLTSRRRINRWLHTGLCFICGTIFNDFLSNFPTIIDWVHASIHRY